MLSVEDQGCVRKGSSPEGSRQPTGCQGSSQGPSCQKSNKCLDNFSDIGFESWAALYRAGCGLNDPWSLSAQNVL